MMQTEVVNQIAQLTEAEQEALREQFGPEAFVGAFTSPRKGVTKVIMTDPDDPAEVAKYVLVSSWSGVRINKAV